jgi:uncharacterized membrane protein YuzA (DUF378 family)
MKAVDVIAAVLVIVGALNWGLVGIADFNLVAALFGTSILASIVYVLVGLAGAYQLFRWATTQRPAFAGPARSAAY